MDEPEVVCRAHEFLKSQELWWEPVVRLYTDAHASLLRYKQLRPFQRFTLDMGDFVLHPDMVGQLGDGETIFAVEAKGDTDLLRGLAQAEMYQVGFHHTFLAADAGALGTSLVDFARRKDIGVIAVGAAVEIVHLPEARMPLRRAFQFVARQMESVVQVTSHETFAYNLPTHYLVWVIALEPGVTYSIETLPAHLGEYPIPKGWRSTVSAAQKLGLVSVHGDVAQLTPVGAAAKEILPANVEEWTRVHEAVSARGSHVRALVRHRREAGALLRLLLLQDPTVRLIIEGLRMFPDQTATFAALAVACDQLDHARAPILFLKPEAAAALTDERGRVRWQLVTGEDYRSTTFYQFKSILKHAGILTERRLGGATTKGYEPTEDVWELR